MSVEMILIQRIALSLEPLIPLMSNSCHLWIRDEWRISAICCDCHIIGTIRIFLWHSESYFSQGFEHLYDVGFMHVILNFSFNTESHILLFFPLPLFLVLFFYSFSPIVIILYYFFSTMMSSTVNLHGIWVIRPIGVLWALHLNVVCYQHI